ncbi:unnamed protein product [Lampetra planeri]
MEENGENQVGASNAAGKHAEEVRKVTELKEAAPDLAWEARTRFLQRVQMQDETPYAFRAALLALGREAYSLLGEGDTRTLSGGEAAGAGKKIEGCPGVCHQHGNFILKGGREDTGLRGETAAGKVGGRDMEPARYGGSEVQNPAETGVTGSMDRIFQEEYPRLDEAVLDSLVMEKMLPLVQEMAMVLPIVEEAAQTWPGVCGLRR